MKYRDEFITAAKFAGLTPEEFYKKTAEEIANKKHYSEYTLAERLGVKNIYDE